jgi:NADH-quinone oxidoreductase subunit F
MSPGLQSILSDFVGTPDEIIPIMQRVQETYSYLPEDSMIGIARFTGVPESWVYGVATFYNMFSPQPAGQRRVHVCTSPMCTQAGGDLALQEACQHYGLLPGETTPDGQYTIEEAECLGLCDYAPAALVDETPVAGIDALAPPDWVENPQGVPPGNLGGSPRWLSARCSQNDPVDLSQFEASGGFMGLKEALKMTPAEVIAHVEQSGLTGRGGAAFPTGLKWKFTSEAAGEVKYVICNADESEPGTFKDRVLIEGDPYQILEGMLIAAYAISANQGYIYLRGEYPRARHILDQAIETARAHGYLGEDLLGSGFSFDVEIHSGAGAYICGEETALFESIEGKRGNPRVKPPFPTSHGLFGRPTMINNVETLCAAAWVLAHGPAAYRSVGTEESPGTKLFCLTGDVYNRGVYEAPFGVTLAELLEMAGGVQGELQAALLGGAAGAFAGPEHLNIPMSFESLREAELPLGSGVISVINTHRDLRVYLLSLAKFFANESCGKCFPCRLGTRRQVEIIERVAARQASQDDLAALKDVGMTMQHASLCGLGKTASLAVLSALNRWPQAFQG